MNLTKDVLAAKISKETGLRNKRVVKAVLDAAFSSVLSLLKDGHSIEIRGFGTFSLRHRKSRPALNPRTGEKVTIPPRNAPHLAFSENARKTFNP
jgi:DNA-binding protein HU-beta